MVPRALIFEDNDILRSMLKCILEEFGYEVFTFYDSGFCPVWDSINHKCPFDNACADIIISGADMPTKTGLELIEDRKQKGCKINHRALMSGGWTHSNLKYAQELDCHLLHKPFNFEEILQWLDDCSKQIAPNRKLSNLLTEKN